MENKYKYVAFISYRHTKPDFEIATKIHQMIESFKVPKELDPEGKYKELRVFRDREELTTKDLSESLDEALRKSEYLIIVCSKRTPLSPWCTREVREFKKYHDDSKIIPVLIEGEPFESFNEELTNLKSIEVNDKGEEIIKPLELLAADVRPDEVKSPNFIGYENLEFNNKEKLDELTKKSSKILKSSEIYRIMATILGVNFGDLKQRQKERRLKRIITGSVASVLILLAFGISMTNLYFKAVAAQRQATQQTSMMTLKAADQANLEGDRSFAMLISKEAISNAEPEMNSYNELMANYTRILNDALLTPKYSTLQVLKTDSETPFYDIAKGENWLISGSELNTANIWNINNGEILKTLEFSAPVSAVNIVNDNSIAYISTKDGILFKLNPHTYEYEEVLSSNDISFTEIGTNTNGKYLFGLRGTKHAQIYNTEDFSLINEIILEGDNYIKFISMLPHRDQYIIAYTNGSVFHYDMKTGNVLKEIEPVDEENEYPIGAVNLSKDGSTFAYSNRDKITIYTIDTGEKFEITDSVFFPLVILLNEDGTKIFADSSSGISMWDLKTREYKKSFNFIRKRVSNMSLSNDENTLVVGFSDDYSIGVFENVNDFINNYSDDLIISPGSNHKDNIVTLNFTDDDKYIISSSQDSTIKIISTSSTLSQKNLNGEIKAVSPDGNTLFLMDSEFNISRYNFLNDKEESLGQVSENLGTILNVYGVSNNGEFFAFSDTFNKNAIVFNDKGQRIFTTKSHPSKNPFGVVSKLLFTNDSKFLFTLGEDGEVFITDIKKGEFIKEIKDLEERSNKIVLSEDGSILGIGYLNGTTSIIDVKNSQVLERIEGDVFLINGNDGKIDSLVGQYGKRLFEFKNGSVEYYASNEERRGISNLELNRDIVSKDGNYLITTVSGMDTIVTDLKTGFRVRTLPTLGEITSMATISGDGRKIAYEYSEDNTIISDFYNIETLESLANDILLSRELTDDEKAEIGLISRVENE